MAPSSTVKPQVGATIRAPRNRVASSSDGGVGRDNTGRALIAALSSDRLCASLLWEDPAPRVLPPPPGGDGGRRKRRLARPFVVAPYFGDGKISSIEDAGDEEEDVPVASLAPLLPFEESSADIGEPSNAPPTVVALKERGDALLRLRDYSSASSYYEVALSATSELCVGCTVVLSRGGRPVLAEVDCIDDDDNVGGTALDVAYLSAESVGEEEEGTVNERDVLLCMLEEDEEGLQERILLNLSRCLLRLAEVDVAGKRGLDRPTKYRKAAVLGCTLAIACASHRRSEDGDSEGGVKSVGSGTTEEKALLLRTSAYSDLGKSKHAAADLRRVLSRNPGCAQAKRLTREMEAREKRRKKVDKKLAKEMCQWVQHATDSAEGRVVVSDDDNDEDGGDDDDALGQIAVGQPTSGSPNPSSEHRTSLMGSMLLLSAVLVPVLAVFLRFWAHADESGSGQE